MEIKFRLCVGGVLRFLIVFGVLVLMWWFFHTYVLFVAFVVMISCVIISAALLWFAGKGLRVEAVMPEGRVGRASDFPVSIQIRNPMKLIGFNAEVVYRWGNVFTDTFQTQKEQLWISPGKGANLRQIMKSRYAGRVEVQFEKFKVYDLFRIFCLIGCESKGAWVLAYPQPEHDEEEEIFNCVEGFPKDNETKRRGTDYNPDYEVREYIPGDELKSIHWKLTAKQNRLMVRERLATGRQRIDVVLPLCGDREQNDRLMDSLYSLSLILLKKEYPIQLFWSGKGEELCSRFLAEQGELENVIGEILSGNGLNLTGGVQEKMAIQYPGENYILVQTGAYKGAYIK